MSFAKYAALPDDKKGKVYHCTRHREYVKMVSDFYKTQKIDHEILIVEDSNKYMLKNIGDYDACLGTYWHERNNIIPSWEIEPFPKIKYNHLEGIDFVINVTAGRQKRKRVIAVDIIKKFITMRGPEKVVLVGFSNDDYSFAGNNDYTNKTKMEKYVSLICSGKVLIGHGGFACYLAAMNRRKVYIFSEGIDTDERQHPKWDMIRIRNLAEVK
jgi:hypothetical protein